MSEKTSCQRFRPRQSQLSRHERSHAQLGCCARMHKILQISDMSSSGVGPLTPVTSTQCYHRYTQRSQHRFLDTVEGLKAANKWQEPLTTALLPTVTKIMHNLSVAFTQTLSHLALPPFRDLTTAACSNSSNYFLLNPLLVHEHLLYDLFSLPPSTT